jgi:hypothetical protein
LLSNVPVGLIKIIKNLTQGGWSMGQYSIQGPFGSDIRFENNKVEQRVEHNTRVMLGYTLLLGTSC